MSVPSYLRSCLTPSWTEKNTVFLVGTSPARENTLEVYSVDLTNIANPIAKLLTTQTNNSTQYWGSSQPLGCYPYAGQTNSNTGTSFLVVQFGAFRTLFANVNLSATSSVISEGSFFPVVAFKSPQNFAINGAAGTSIWILGETNTTVPWSGIRFSDSTASNSIYTNDLTTTPTGNPLLTVGAYEVDGNNGKGYNTVFDYLGSGTTYTVTGSTTASTAQNIIALTNPQSVSMGGISLTSNAIPVTMGSTSYILDQRSDGSTAVYYIKQSSSSSNLSPLSIKGQVIKFNSILSATTLGSYIITYSNSASSLTPTFNSLDTTTGVWSGPGLITSTLPPLTGSNPSSPPSGSSGNGSLTPNNGADNGDSKSLPLGGIIGGVVGGLIVIAAAIYLLVRRRRKNENSKLTIDQKPTDNLHQNHNQVSQIFPQQLQKSIQSPQAYHLHQPQEGYEQNQEHQIFNPNFTSSQQVYQPIQHPQQPQLYSGQSEHVYIPPTLIPPQYENNPISSQQPAPVIIESPVQSVGSSPANSHIIYSTTGLPRAPECRDANWNSATTIVPITSTSNKQLSSTVLDQIQALYQNPPANPQQTP